MRITDEYEVINEDEIAALLDEIPTELTKTSIEKQIRDPFFSSTNFFEPFIEKCDYILTEFQEDDDITRDINDLKESMASFILNTMDEYYGFDFDLESLAGNISELTDLADVCYRFFILNYRKHTIKYIFRYIKEHRKEFYKAYEENIGKKDVGTINAKQISKDKEWCVILSLLPSIIRDVLETGCDDVCVYVNTVAEEDSYEAEVIHTMVQRLIINGEPLDRLFGIIIASDDISGDIYAGIRTKIIKKIGG
jgi:hypothetical protein